jgi:hypothetical protein
MFRKLKYIVAAITSVLATTYTKLRKTALTPPVPNRIGMDTEDLRGLANADPILFAGFLRHR